ncbi:DUF3592 domain-containing protein [Blautia obeum]|uniref:DUF3592 domain-containing protein n=1 Tax=Blautia obeum TaxID=40520 RepID=A0A174PJA7_9FIRM|nr:DUF3592 domain-containing protein [Blautia obeum]CUP58890.1 Uncharacterised protein [Blautia obeum]
MKKLNYTEDLLRVIFFWIGTFFLVSGILSFLGILKPAVNSGIQNPDMLGTVFSITGVLLCIISAALGIYTAKLDKLHLQLIENGTKVKGLVEKVYLQKYTRYRRQIPYRILYSFTYHDKVYYHKSRLVWEKPDLKKGDLITVYVNNLGMYLLLPHLILLWQAQTHFLMCKVFDLKMILLVMKSYLILKIIFLC